MIRRAARPLAFIALFLGLAVPPVAVALRATSALHEGRILVLEMVKGDPRYGLAAWPYGLSLALATLDGVAAPPNLRDGRCDRSGGGDCLVDDIPVNVLLAAGPDGVHRPDGLSLDRPDATVPFVRATLRDAYLVGRGDPVNRSGAPCQHDGCLTGRITLGFEDRPLDRRGLPGLDADQIARVRAVVRTDPEGIPTLDAIGLGDRILVRTERLW